MGLVRIFGLVHKGIVGIYIRNGYYLLNFAPNEKLDFMFHFREFCISQSQSAQKVCTDSCLFGAWVAQLPRSAGWEYPPRVLDVGAGTGLLSLMLAQAWPDSFLDALEPDPGSAADCTFNFLQSPWSERVAVYPAAWADWHHREEYDWVISNPPFFIDHLSTGKTGPDAARHIGKEEWFEWLTACARFCRPGGKIALLMIGQAWEKSRPILASENLVLRFGVRLHQARIPDWRVMVCLEKAGQTGPENWQSLNLYARAGVWNAPLRTWLQPYYLDKALGPAD